VLLFHFWCVEQQNSELEYEKDQVSKEQIDGRLRFINKGQQLADALNQRGMVSNHKYQSQKPDHKDLNIKVNPPE
jgi:hypothetical protein